MNRDDDTFRLCSPRDHNRYETHDFCLVHEAVIPTGEPCPETLRRLADVWIEGWIGNRDGLRMLDQNPYIVEPAKHRIEPGSPGHTFSCYEECSIHPCLGAGCPNNPRDFMPSARSARTTCGCPVNEVGDVPCHDCGEYVNKRCWNCKTPRGEGVCPNPRTVDQEASHD